LVSAPYIKMTLALMQDFGWLFDRNENSLKFLTTDSQLSTVHVPQSTVVEMDWSSASYWYSLVALSENAEITLSGLQEQSIQGDAIIAKWMKNFGVETKFDSQGAYLFKVPFIPQKLSFDFTDNPDLAQTVIVLCAAFDLEAEFTGLQTLRIKETDRISALQKELKKFGKNLFEENGKFIPKGKFQVSKQIIQTYNDHRMAMAFAPLVLKCGELEIENPKEVEKSYPGFWGEINSLI